MDEFEIMPNGQTKIPPPPWTEAALEAVKAGLYVRLAVEYGACLPQAGYRPDLDLTSAYNKQQAPEEANNEGGN